MRNIKQIFKPIPDNTALLLIDLQNDFIHDEGVVAKLGNNVKPLQSIIPMTNWLINMAKQVSIPVISVLTNHDAMTSSHAWKNRDLFDEHKMICLTGHWGAENFMIDSAIVDYVVIKNRYSGFHGTNLDLILRSLERDRLLVCGVTTNVCVESTIRDANSYDYLSVLVSDCTAAFTKAEHESGLFNINNYFGYVLTANEIASFWDIKDNQKTKKMG